MTTAMRIPTQNCGQSNVCLIFFGPSKSSDAPMTAGADRSCHAFVQNRESQGRSHNQPAARFSGFHSEKTVESKPKE